MCVTNFVFYFQNAWVNCQRDWIYLEPVFTAVDIQRQLPGEAKMFMKADRSWKEIMRKANNYSNAHK